MPTDSKPYKPPYAFSICIGEACTRKMRTFVDLAEKLTVDATDLMRRFTRVVAVDAPHRLTQRGNGRRFILDCDADRKVYLSLLRVLGASSTIVYSRSLARVSTIFYSWQSDRPAVTCRNFIERALQSAVDRLRADTEIEPSLRDDLEVDRDTKNVPGSPAIFDTIMAKIASASIFVPDLTFVGLRADERPIRTQTYSSSMVVRFTNRGLSASSP